MIEATATVVPAPQEIKLTPAQEARFWAKVDKINGPLPDQANPHYKGLGRCWDWTAALYSNGYGHFVIKGKGYLAHRLAWRLTHGSIPEGKIAMHLCDRPRCCCPSHIQIGSYLDNSKDMVRKGRHDQRTGMDSPSFGRRKSFCTKGHPMVDGNIVFTNRGKARRCKICYAISSKAGSIRYNTRNRAEINARKMLARGGPKGVRKGEGVNTCKLTASKVLEIRALYASGKVFQFSLAAMFGVTQATISAIIRRKIWDHIPAVTTGPQCDKANSGCE